MAFDPLSIGLTLAGGLLGAGGGGEKQTAERKMDPRLDRYVYGPDNESGLLGGAFGLLQQQAAQGGLNDLQRQGLEMQRQFLMSPEYSQGYNQMRSLGQGLLGAGVAGNPFTGGGTVKPQAGGFSYSGLMDAKLPEATKAAAPRLEEKKPVPANLGLAGDYVPSPSSSYVAPTVNPWDPTGERNGYSFGAWGPYAGGGDYSGYTTGSGYSYGGFGGGNSGMGD